MSNGIVVSFGNPTGRDATLFKQLQVVDPGLLERVYGCRPEAREAVNRLLLLHGDTVGTRGLLVTLTGKQEGQIMAAGAERAIKAQEQANPALRVLREQQEEQDAGLARRANLRVVGSGGSN